MKFINRNIYLLLLIVGILVSTSNLYAQSGFFDLSGTIYYKGKPAEKAKIEIYENNTVIKSIYTKKNGKFSYQINLGKIHHLKISKERAVPKIIKIDTRVTTKYQKNTYKKQIFITLNNSAQSINGLSLDNPSLFYVFDSKKEAFISLKSDQNKLVEERKKKETADILAEIKSLSLEAQEFINAESLNSWLDNQYVDFIMTASDLEQMTTAQIENLFKEAKLQTEKILKQARADSAFIVKNAILDSVALNQKMNKMMSEVTSQQSMFNYKLDSVKLVENKLIEEKRREIEALRKNQNLSAKDTVIIMKNKLAMEEEMLRLAELEVQNGLLSAKTREDSMILMKRGEELKLARTNIDKIKEELRVKEEKVKYAELELENQRSRMIALYGGLAALLLLSLLIIRSNRKEKKFRRELQTKNRKLDELNIAVQESDNAVMITDSKGDFTWINKGFTKMFGFSMDELLEKSVNILGAEATDEVRETMNRVFSEKKTERYEYEAATKDGKKIWVQTTVTPILDEKQEIERMVVIDADVSVAKKQEQEIRAHRDSMRDSITYAQTIQTAILPLIADIQQNMNAFVLFRPKDIVSGDFFWYSYFPEKNCSFIAAIDCTGHGVPGAFMSMIGTSLLNQIVNEEGESDPAVILEKLHQKVRKSLMQDRTNNKDGMDVSFCKIENIKEGEDEGKDLITFCGAKRPIFYHRKNTKKVERIRGSSKAIGGQERAEGIPEVFFENKELILDKGDVLFLTSDGFFDQNNIKRRKMGTKRFSDLVLSVIDQPMPKIQEKLEWALDKFQEGTEQRDDITIIGIRVD